MGKKPDIIKRTHIKFATEVSDPFRESWTKFIVDRSKKRFDEGFAEIIESSPQVIQFCLETFFLDIQSTMRYLEEEYVEYLIEKSDLPIEDFI